MGAEMTGSNFNSTSCTSTKRKRNEITNHQLTRKQTNPRSTEEAECQENETPVEVKKVQKSKVQPGEEKRAKRFREKAPTVWLQRLERAITQRMFVLNRERTETNDTLEESVELAGSTGNVYTVTIKNVPSCTCPDGRKGNICKHIIYVLRLVLKAPSTLEYQMAFLSSELRLIFAQAPLPTHEAASEDQSNRKPIDGDCPVCFMEFNSATEEIVWCKAACGNNIHRLCFEQWAKSAGGKEVRCVYCRSHWKGDEPSMDRIRASKEGRQVNEEGYINLSSDLGISTYRDTSTYHSYWVDRQRIQGFDFDTR